MTDQLDRIDSWEPDYDAPPAEADLSNPALVVEGQLATDRHLRYIAAIDGHQADDDAYVARVLHWAEDRRVARAQRRAWHVKACTDFLAALHALDGRTKSLSLPHGKVTSRTAKAPRVTVTDEAAFIAWASESCPQALTIPPTPAPKVDKRHLLDHLDVVIDGETMRVLAPGGEVVPGVSVDWAPTTYSVSVSDGELL